MLLYQKRSRGQQNWEEEMYVKIGEPSDAIHTTPLRSIFMFNWGRLNHKPLTDETYHSENKRCAADIKNNYSFSWKYFLHIIIYYNYLLINYHMAESCMYKTIMTENDRQNFFCVRPRIYFTTYSLCLRFTFLAHLACKWFGPK